MLSYIIEHREITKQHRTLRRIANGCFEHLPNPKGNMSCYEVARIVAKLLDVDWQENRFHAWCLTEKLPAEIKESNDPEYILHAIGQLKIGIIDVYAYGRYPAVQLVYPHVMHPAVGQQFLVGERVQPIDESVIAPAIAWLEPYVTAWKINPDMLPQDSHC